MPTTKSTGKLQKIGKYYSFAKSLTQRVINYVGHNPIWPPSPLHATKCVPGLQQQLFIWIKFHVTFKPSTFCKIELKEKHNNLTLMIYEWKRS